VAEAVAKVKMAVLDLPIMLVTGEAKKLRFCYGSELAALGSAYQRISAAVKPDEMIGERLCEREVRALLELE
jgi:hypothetical protein